MAKKPLDKDWMLPAALIILAFVVMAFVLAMSM